VKVTDEKCYIFDHFYPKISKIDLIFPFCNIFNFKNVTKHFYPQSPSDPLPVRLTEGKASEF